MATVIQTTQVHKATPVTHKPSPVTATRKVIPIAIPIPVAPIVYPVGCQYYLPIIEKYNWDVHTAMAIVQAESSCNPHEASVPNYDGSVDRGLFQVNSIHADMVGGDLTSLYNPEVNVQIAYRIYSGNGWHAWSTYNSGKYARYL